MLPVRKINMFFPENFIIELKCHRYDVNASNIFYNTKNDVYYRSRLFYNVKNDMKMPEF
jgi:hypothetical protein